MTGTSIEPAVWFPAVRTRSGTDIFTERLAQGLRNRRIRAEITWLPHRSEYAPWTVTVPKPPPWANIAHVNSWLNPCFIPQRLPVVATEHLCVLDPALYPYTTLPQKIYHHLWIKHVERRLLARAQQVTAVSNYTANRVRELYGVGSINVVWNGVDLSTFHPAPRERPHSPFRLLFVGNWSSRKGADLLVPIMRELGTAFELWILSGRRGPTLGADVTNIRVLASRDKDGDLAEVYRNCDALLFPTRLEGLPLASLEAQACGVPVITTNSSSLPEVVENGVTGLLCPCNDVASFAAAVRQLASNSHLWQSISLSARARAVNLFDIESMIDRYVAVYRSACAE